MKHSSGNNASVMLVVMVMVSLVAIALVGSSAQAAVIPPPHCSPEVADALSPRLRRICAALYGMAEISGAVEQYLDERSKSNYRLLNTRSAQWTWLDNPFDLFLLICLLSIQLFFFFYLFWTNKTKESWISSYLCFLKPNNERNLNLDNWIRLQKKSKLITFPVRSRLAAMSMPLVDGTEHGGVKRQDVDHVFLRFGRR